MENVVLLALLALFVALLVVVIQTRRSFDKNDGIQKVMREEFRYAREESRKISRELREEISSGQQKATETLARTVDQIGKSQSENLELVARRIKELTESNEARIDRVHRTINEHLQALQKSNEKNLERMRQTVDEKLHGTLEKRLGESFRVVSDRLEAVQRGLGEMQSLATGVGDLKRVLTNVKARGTWGEVQLGALLEQMMTPDQYAKDVQTGERSRERVEYAIRLPGTDGTSGSQVWLPIDSKFPQEDYMRLLDATEAVDPEAIDRATTGLLRSVHVSAKEINEKYINPPRTTDFAIMFLPTEGLHAEILRQPGQIEIIQQRYRIAIAGPTTLAAILNSLRMGFQTLALEKRSHEVWTVLAAVKTEFRKFGEVLAKLKKQIATASNTIGQTETRTRAMARKLRNVQQLPYSESAALLGIKPGTTETDPSKDDDPSS